MQNSLSVTQVIRKILERPYEERTEQQHQIFKSFIAKYLNIQSQKQCRWLTLRSEIFDDLANQQKRSHIQIQDQSLVIHCQTKNAYTPQVIKIKNQQDLLKVPNEGYIVILLKRGLNACHALRNCNIQQIIKQLKSFQYLEQIPRKRFYHILRYLDVLEYSFGQVVYLQNTSIVDDCSVFVVKNGDFTFLKRQKETQKNVELCTFSQGSIFGTEEQMQSSNQGQQTHKILKEKRLFTVKCQSSKGILYKFSMDFFNSFMRKSCEGLLRNHNQRLNQFLLDRFVQAQMNLTQNSQLITQPFKRSFSVRFRQTFRSNSLGNLQKKIAFPEMKKFTKQQSNLPSVNLKLQFPSRQRLLSKEQLMKMDPDYQQQKIILMKHYKCEAVRQATKPKNAPLCKGEVLLNLMKTSYQFEKVRYKKNAF